MISDQSFRSMIFGSSGKTPNFAQKLAAINDDAVATRDARLKAQDTIVRDYVLAKCEEVAKAASEFRIADFDISRLYEFGSPLHAKFIYNNPGIHLPNEAEAQQICERVLTQLSDEPYGLKVSWNPLDETGNANIFEVGWY